MGTTPQQEPLVAHATRPRRNHKKSRKGCMECKKRHMKCDEGRPICVNCATSNRQCYFPDHGLISSNIRPSRCICGASSLIPDSNSPVSNPTSSQNPTQSFTFEHLLLFHHVERNMTDWLMVTEEMQPMAQAYIDYALLTPYLMDQLLSISAAHLSTVHLGRSELYNGLAAELQTRALQLFEHAKGDISDANIISMFLFSSLLPVKVLAEKLASHRDNFSAFLDDFVDYLHLHRGARVMGNNSWDVLLNSELERWFNIPDRTSAGEAVMVELESLSRMLQSSDLNQNAIEACQTAKEALEYVHARLHGAKTWGAHALMAWPSLLSVDFIQLLEKRAPEALIILAHFAIVLHQFREFWVFGDAGEYLVQQISEYLGRHWAEWLQAPRWYIGSCHP